MLGVKAGSKGREPFRRPLCMTCGLHHFLLSNNKSTNDYNYSALQQAVLCTMVATTYLATYLV